MQIGLSDVYEQLRAIVPDPEADPSPLRPDGTPRQPLPQPVMDGSSSGTFSGAGQESTGGSGDGPERPAIQAIQGEASGGAAVWVPPDEFQRKSTKFWARPSAIPAIQVPLPPTPPGGHVRSPAPLARDLG